MVFVEPSVPVFLPFELHDGKSGGGVSSRFHLPITPFETAKSKRTTRSPEAISIFPEFCIARRRFLTKFHAYPAREEVRISY
jgi:hypothetical protein